MESGFQRKQKFLQENPQWNDQDYLAIEAAFVEYTDLLSVYVEQMETLSPYGCPTSYITKLKSLVDRLNTFVTSEEIRREM